MILTDSTWMWRGKYRTTAAITDRTGPGGFVRCERVIGLSVLTSLLCSEAVKGRHIRRLTP